MSGFDARSDEELLQATRSWPGGTRLVAESVVSYGRLRAAIRAVS